MRDQSVIVISMADDAWSTKGIKKKLLGKVDGFYYFDENANEEIEALFGERDFPDPEAYDESDLDFTFLFLAAAHRSNEDKSEEKDVTEIIVGQCAPLCTRSGRYAIATRNALLLEKSRCPRPIANLRKAFNLDLSDNYKDTGFVKVETSEAAANHVEYYLGCESESEENDPHSSQTTSKDAKPLEKLRTPDNSAYRLFLENELGIESYSVDYGRIVQSKAFRRLVDKAQIFTSAKGDHYRTRMTHTLEVTRIARLIANRLGGNERLSEAIALAHDIGHTPFGHQGERTLNEILRGRVLRDLGLFLGDEGSCNPYGGFKHNFQSVRVLSSLEECFADFYGLNLAAQVLEGALWHTKAPKKDCENCDEPRTICCERNCFWSGARCVPRKHHASFWNFIFHESSDYDGLKQSLTLEGQIVEMADEIAQRGHDIEDALTAGLISVDELLDLSKIRSVEDLHFVLRGIDNSIKSKIANGRLYVDKQRLRKNILSSKIVDLLIESAVRGSENTCVNSDSVIEFERGPLLKQKIIRLDALGKAICNYLDNLVTSRVLASQEVSRFDNKGKMIVEGLFRAYYTQPRMLPKASLRRLAIVEKNNRCPAALDLSNCDFAIGSEEIEEIKSANIGDQSGKRRSQQTSENVERAFKKKALVRCIVDHIAGMTDSYAAAEYDRIYGTSL